MAEQRDSTLPYFIKYDIGVNVSLYLALGALSLYCGYGEAMVGTGLYYVHILYGAYIDHVYDRSIDLYISI